MTHRERALAPLLALVLLDAALLAVPGIRIGASIPGGLDHIEAATSLPPDLLAFELLKLLTAAVLTWLVLASAISLVMFRAGHHRLAHIALGALPRRVRSMVRPSISLVLTGTLLVSSVSVSTATENGPVEGTDVAVLIHLGSTNAGTSTPTPTIVEPDPAIRDHPTESPPATAVMTDVAEAMESNSDRDQEPDPDTNPVAHSGSATDSTWIVEPGDHFWSIARIVLSAQSEQTPTDSQVAAYWLDLIEVNRSTLPDPHNSDLIYPGMRLVLPTAA